MTLILASCIAIVWFAMILWVLGYWIDEKFGIDGTLTYGFFAVILFIVLVSLSICCKTMSDVFTLWAFVTALFLALAIPKTMRLASRIAKLPAKILLGIANIGRDPSREKWEADKAKILSEILSMDASNIDDPRFVVASAKLQALNDNPPASVRKRLRGEIRLS